MLSNRLLTLILISLSVGCGGTGLIARTESDRGQHRSPGLVTGSDVREAGGRSALDGVRLLIRPPSMTGRAPATFRNPLGDPPVVYLDGVRLTDIRTLDQIHYTTLKSMRFLDASSASIRYGTNHFGGALVVTTHRGPVRSDSSSSPRKH